MNQRASHFHLGNTSQTYGSVYAKDFGPKQPQGAAGRGANPFRSSSLAGDTRSHFATTSQAMLKAWGNAERAKLSEQKLQELKTHHFKLGSYHPPQALTTNQTYHNDKPLSGEASKTQEESKNKMRAHYHDFKEQGHTDYRSAYSAQFAAQPPQPHTPLPHPPANAVQLGNHQLPLLTTSATSFTPKTAPKQPPIRGPTLGVDLGSSNDPKTTMSQLYHDRKHGPPASLPESTLKELRNTHFNVGLMPQTFHTESNNYRSLPPQAPTQQPPVPASGTWVDSKAPFHATTTNQHQLPPRTVQPFSRAVQATRAGVDLGGYRADYVSEAKSGFQSPGEIQVPEKMTGKGSDVVIGVGSGSYQTEHKSSFIERDLKAGKAEIDIVKLSREDHFHLGGTGVNVPLTVYQDEHRKDHDNRSKAFHKTNV